MKGAWIITLMLALAYFACEVAVAVGAIGLARAFLGHGANLGVTIALGIAIGVPALVWLDARCRRDIDRGFLPFGWTAPKR